MKQVQLTKLFFKLFILFYSMSALIYRGKKQNIQFIPSLSSKFKFSFFYIHLFIINLTPQLLIYLQLQFDIYQLATSMTSSSHILYYMYLQLHFDCKYIFQCLTTFHYKSNHKRIHLIVNIRSVAKLFYRTTKSLKSVVAA